MHISRTHIFLAGLVFSVAALSIFITAIEAQPASGKINFHDNFSSGKLDAWQFPFPEDWVVKGEGPPHDPDRPAATLGGSATADGIANAPRLPDACHQAGRKSPARG